jgi:transcriptional regulator with PAS, ATPase and Fis domain
MTEARAFTAELDRPDRSGSPDCLRRKALLWFRPLDMGTTTQIEPVWAPLERLRAVVVSGPDPGLAVVVDRNVLAGTSDLCDLRLTDRTVSRRHLTLSPGGVGVRVRDEDSRNGTWFQDCRIVEAEVPAGAEIRLGATVLRIERDTSGAAGDRPPEPAEARAAFGRFLGSAPCLRVVYDSLERAAQSDVTVLLEGESGTGKELVAEGLHELGARRSGPFVVVDCGAVAEGLLESELFGHERGAFTGADRSRVGAFEAADGGTIFLDEIGELGLSLQSRLLRVLDQRQVRRLGSQRVIPVDVRVIAATNRNLEREVEESRFRLDLFHRIAVILIRVPPLREREGDVELLARHFVGACGASPSILTSDVLSRMTAHSWPGNVRELRNYIERLVLLGEGGAGLAGGGAPDPLGRAAVSGLPYRQARAQVLQSFTERYVEHMLASHGGNVSAAARSAGVARRHFQRLKARPGSDLDD